MVAFRGALMNEPIDYAALDVQPSATARPSAGKSSRWAIPVLVVLGGSAIAYLFASDYSHRQASLTERDNVQFQPPPFQARSFQEERPAPKEHVVQIPKVPADPPGKQAWASDAAPQGDDEAQRRALEEQRWLEAARRQAAEDARLQEEARRIAEAEERARWERLRSGLIIIDNDRVGPLSSDGVGGALRPDQEADANRRFLAGAGHQDFDIARASKNFRTDALVAQGTMIQGVLETAIQSDLPGNVRAITSEDVYSFDGRRVLIPAGTRLIGEYRSGLARGQTRVFVVWTRMLRADGVSVSLGSIGTDPLGRAGVGGEVDNHSVERFGSAILLTLVGGGAQYIAGLGQQRNFNDYNAGSGTIQVVDPATGRVTILQQTNNQSVDQYGRQIASQTVAQSLTQLANEALRDSINIPPTVHVDQGTKISIFVRRDLDFSAFYPDPVRQEARRLASRRVVRKDAAAAPVHDDIVIPGTAELLPGVFPARPVFKP